jgi:hypothetical protein
MLTILLIVIACGAQSEGNKYVGYIDNFHCTLSECRLVRSGKPEVITPYQPLQAGDQIIVYNEGNWVVVKLKNKDKKEKVDSSKPYPVPKNKDTFSPEFFNKIRTLIDYFGDLYEDDMGNRPQSELGPSDCQFPLPQNKGASVGVCKKQGLKQETTNMLKAICSEPRLPLETRNTMLAALLVMQKEGNWKQEVPQLLDGKEVGYYYPSCLVKKELNRTK